MYEGDIRMRGLPGDLVLVDNHANLHSGPLKTPRPTVRHAARYDHLPSAWNSAFGAHRIDLHPMSELNGRLASTAVIEDAAAKTCCSIARTNDRNVGGGDAREVTDAVLGI